MVQVATARGNVCGTGRAEPGRGADDEESTWLMSAAIRDLASSPPYPRRLLQSSTTIPLNLAKSFTFVVTSTNSFAAAIAAI